MKPQRAKGVVTYRSPENPNILAAKQLQKQKQEEAAARRAARYSQPVPNWIAYKDIVFKVGVNVDETGRWLGGKLPPCKVCGGILPPREHHVCSSFQPKFVEYTPERKERWEAKREEIREARRLNRGVFCSECGDLLECPEDAQWHFEDHGGKPYREHYALDGEHDGDLDGYEDEPEEDYCEGDDDGYDCD
jgi:hypothetical protein